MSDNFKIKLNCVVFSTNVGLNKRYLLSLDKDKMVFPSMELSEDNLSNVDEALIKFLKQYVFVSDLELFPQLINLHSLVLSEDKNTINVVYGFIVKHTSSINNAHWVEFQVLSEQKNSQLVFEVMQKLR